MLKNENTNIVQTPSRKMKERIFSSEANDQLMLQTNYFKRQSRSQRKSLNTKPILRKNSPSIRDRKYYAKSGFNLNKNQIPTTQALQIQNGNNFANSIFKRRVNSETKVSQKSISFVNQQNTSQRVSKINYGKKIIQNLKRDTFKLQRNNSRYSSSYNSSKSVETGEKSLINRQKIVQSSMQKLKPSFNINEVKFCSSKKSLRKLVNLSNIETKKSNISLQRPQDIKIQGKISSYQTKFRYSNDQFLRKMLKKASQPLNSYSEFIKGRQNYQYYIKMQHFSQYLIVQKNQKILVNIDFSTLKLLQSIYLCLIDLLSVQVQNMKIESEKLLNYEILKEYAEVYFQTYSKMKVEFILCEGIFKTTKKKLIQFFVMQRIIFYWILQKCKTQEIIESKVGIKKVVEFLKLSEEIIKTIITMLYEDLTQNNQHDSLIDTFKSLRLTRQIDKRLSELKLTIDSIKQFDSSSDLLRCFIELLTFIEKQGNFDIIMMFKLQQYFNWTQQMIPPLFHLPPIFSKPYTLIIDLDGTLIYYNEQTKILKYRPYMDRFLTAMQKYFEIIIFSSHTKDRTDIIVKEIERDQRIFAYRLYKSHLVFKDGILRKNIDYLGRSMQNLIFIDDEQKNTQLRPLNSFRIKPFIGDKQDKQLLNLTDWLTSLIENQPLDIRGKLKKHQTDLDQVLEVDQKSSTIQQSIEYFEDVKTKKSIHKK